MKHRIFILGLVGLLLPLIPMAQHLTIAKKIETAHKNGVQFQKSNLFSISRSYSNKELSSFVSKSAIFDVNIEELKTFVTKKATGLSMSVPMPNGKEYELELIKVNVMSDDFILTMASTGDRPTKFKPSVTYHGNIKGHPGSLVALTLDETEIFGVFSTPTMGNIVLGKIINDKTDRHILYYERDMLIERNFTCEYPELALNKNDLEAFRNAEEQTKINTKTATKCVKVYLECDYDMFLESGHMKTTKRMLNIFSVVALLYANEGITIETSQIKVWDVPDNYSTNSTLAALYDFRTKAPSFNGDIAHLVSRGAPSNAGRAHVDVLCSQSSYGYSGIHSSYNGFPSYSWTVEVITHEIGHNLGSRHTHDCAWNGNNTAIDGCGYDAGYGGCPGSIPSSGGTIMSYCHLNSVGINFSNGFGSQPGNLIRNRVANASCLGCCFPDYEYDLYIETNVTSGSDFQQAENSILACNSICTGAAATYSAGGSVTLTPNFHAQSGSTFHAYIEGCGNTKNKTFANNHYQEVVYEEIVNDAILREDVAAEEKHQLATLQIFPNPTTGHLTIQYPFDSAKTYKVQLYDNIGRSILRTTIGASNNELNLKHLSNGLYIVKLSDGEKILTRKILISK